MKIHDRKSKRTKRKYTGGILFVESTYNVLVSFEQPFCETRDGKTEFGWETVECSVPVNAWNADAARSKAYLGVSDMLCKTFPLLPPDLHIIEIKSVEELPETIHMRRIGAPELFPLATRI